MCTDGRPCSACLATSITAGTRVIAAALPAIGTVVAVTANDAALLSHTGEYLPAALPGEALLCGEEAIGLRLHPGRITGTLLTPRALILSGETGSHRAYFTPQSDSLAIEALRVAPTEQPEPAAVHDWSSTEWADTDQITHFDGLTAERYHVMPFTGARQIEPRRLPYLFAHLTEIGLPFTVAVPGGGCVQLHRGAAAMVDESGSYLAVVFGACRYALDPVAISECWVTQAHGATGWTSAVELYDHGNQCVTTVTQTGAIRAHEHRAWERIAASLPSAASGNG